MSLSIDTMFAACAKAPTSPGDRRPNTSQFKVPTLNAAFLFFGTPNYKLSCPGQDCRWRAVDDAEKHVAQIASVLQTLKSDIIQINEVKDCAVLEALITQLERLGDFTFKSYLIKGTDTTTGQYAALLTRVDPIMGMQRSIVRVAIPVKDSTCPDSSGFSSSKGVSKLFFTTINVTGFYKPITLVGAHLLASPTRKSRCFEREPQAAVLASVANAAVDEGHHTIIAGDLNEWSKLVPDKNNNILISAVLSILTGKEFVDVQVSSLDHMLVSKSLSSAIQSVSFNYDLYTTSCSG